MEDSGATFDEQVPVDTQPDWGIDLFRAETPVRQVRASVAGLDVDGVCVIAHDRIVTAFLSARKEHRVIVADGMRRVTIHLGSRAEAERLLAALAFTTTEKNAVFRLLPAFHLPSGSGLVLPFAAMTAVLFMKQDRQALPIFLLGALAIMVIIAQGIFSRKLVVGRDGINIAGLWSKRFVSYSDVISVNLYSDTETRRRRRARNRNEIIYSGVVLHLRGGEDLRLPITRGTQPNDELFGANERIAEALKAWRASAPLSKAPIERGGRNTTEWISSLRELGRSDKATYRVAAVDREALFAIVEDPANQASSRAAAAIAIGAKLDEESRTRLRASAAAVADPKLRVAIEHVVDEKEEELTDLLDELAPIEMRERSC